jgi:hypothetical protein
MIRKYLIGTALVAAAVAGCSGPQVESATAPQSRWSTPEVAIPNGQQIRLRSTAERPGCKRKWPTRSP